MTADLRSIKAQGSDRIYPDAAPDLGVVSTTIQLLRKLVAATPAKAAERRVLSKALRVFERWPQVGKPVHLSVELVGPRRWLGDCEVFHWWDVHIEDYALHVSSGGHTFSESSGCDTFVSFTWDAAPGVPSAYCDCLHQLALVPDAMPFAAEVSALDLSQPGCTVGVFDAADPQQDFHPATPERPTAAVPGDRQAAAPGGCELCGRGGLRARGSPDQAPHKAPEPERQPCASSQKVRYRLADSSATSRRGS